MRMIHPKSEIKDLYRNGAYVRAEEGYFVIGCEVWHRLWKVAGGGYVIPDGIYLRKFAFSAWWAMRISEWLKDYAVSRSNWS